MIDGVPFDIWAAVFSPDGKMLAAGDMNGVVKVFETEGWTRLREIDVKDQLRSLQDWYVRYQLQSVEGVSEVASIGGFVKQYQIDVDPNKLRAQRVTLPEVYEAVRKSNIDVGAKVVEQNGLEFFIRGAGFIKTVRDVENIVLRQEAGTPIFVKNVATVQLGPDFRRGVLDNAGTEAVGGIVLMRYGENPLAVIERVKERIKEIEPGLKIVLPDDAQVPVRIVPYYDRTNIIYETMGTLREALTEGAIVVAVIVLLFLLHLRSSLAILPTLPLSVLISVSAMYWLGVDGNIMSLAGIAIAIGDVADMGIIMTENIYRRLAEQPERRRDPAGFRKLVEEGAHEVGPAILTAVTNTVLSFVPVFFLEGQEGKLFKPLAYTKTFAIAASVMLALTVVPALALLTLKELRWSRAKRLAVALGVGLIAGTAARLLLPASESASGWPTTFAIAAIAAAACWRITGEELRPVEQNPVSRAIRSSSTVPSPRDANSPSVDSRRITRSIEPARPGRGSNTPTQPLCMKPSPGVTTPEAFPGGQSTSSILVMVADWAGRSRPTPRASRTAPASSRRSRSWRSCRRRRRPCCRPACSRSRGCSRGSRRRTRH